MSAGNTAIPLMTGKPQSLEQGHSNYQGISFFKKCTKITAQNANIITDTVLLEEHNSSGQYNYIQRVYFGGAEITIYQPIWHSLTIKGF